MKKIFIIVLLVVSINMLFAQNSYQEIVDKAKQNSDSLKVAEYSYLNSKLSYQRSNLDKSISVSLSNVTAVLYPNLTLSPTVVINLNNDSNTTITASLSSGTLYDNPSNYSFNPTVRVSNTYDLTGFDKDLLSDLNQSRGLLSNELSYQKSILSFESSIISSLKNIITYEKNIFSQKYSLSLEESDLENKLKVGSISEDSVTYKQKINKINLLKANLLALEKQYESMKEQFESSTGLVWSGVSELPTPNLELKLLESGNTSVIISAISKEIAQANLDKATNSLNPQSLKVDATLQSTNMNNLNKVNTIGANGSVEYSQSNWSIGSKIDLGYDFNTSSFSKPTVTLTGSWHNKVNSKSQELELEELNNNLLSSENSYNQELTNYRLNYQSYNIEVMQYLNDVEQSKAEREYQEANLEYVKELYELGLVTKAELDRAHYDVDILSYDEKLTILTGLALENKIKQFNL